MLRLEQGTLGRSRLRQLFFEPFQFHLQASDLLVQLGFLLLEFAQRLLGVALEQISSAIEQLRFPLADLVGVDARVAAELRKRFGALGCL
jgi:hypothetical protein